MKQINSSRVLVSLHRKDFMIQSITNAVRHGNNSTQFVATLVKPVENTEYLYDLELMRMDETGVIHRVNFTCFEPFLEPIYFPNGESLFNIWIAF